MHVNATSGRASANSDKFRLALAPLAAARWFASTMASSKRMIIGVAVETAARVLPLFRSFPRLLSLPLSAG